VTPISVGPFLLHTPLAAGGMGVVWQGAHAATGIPVAVKAITAARAREPRYQAAFRDEVRAVAGLAHPGIVLVYEHGRIGRDEQLASAAMSVEHTLVADSPYLVMELALGGTVEDAWDPTSGTWEELRGLLLQTLGGLAHAHARGVLHRDLKPRNVLAFGAPGEGPVAWKLADFGLAGPRDAGPGLPAAGTPPYMAPEQFTGGRLGPPTDLYQLGCVAWELATGMPPHVAEGRDRRRDPATPPRAYRSWAEAHLNAPIGPFLPRAPVAAGFEGWVRRMLARRPGDRFAFAADAAAALALLEQPAPSPIHLREHPGPPPEGTPGGGTTLEAVPRAEILRSPVAEPDRRPPRPGATPTVQPQVPPTWRRADDGLGDTAVGLLRGAGLGLYGMRDVPLVGRTEERDRIWEALLEVDQTARTRCLLLRGGAGAGKSRLSRWTAERAHELGAAGYTRLAHSSARGEGGVGQLLARHFGVVGVPTEALLEPIERQIREGPQPPPTPGRSRTAPGSAST